MSINTPLGDRMKFDFKIKLVEVLFFLGGIATYVKAMLVLVDPISWDMTFVDFLWGAVWCSPYVLLSYILFHGGDIIILLMKLFYLYKKPKKK